MNEVLRRKDIKKEGREEGSGKRYRMSANFKRRSSSGAQTQAS